MWGTVDSLGPIANIPFDFDSTMWNPKTIRSPPAHLVSLHHDACSPNARYIFLDVLTPMQSALFPLQILALYILCAILRCHDIVMFKPLLKSGALCLNSALFPSLHSFYASIVSYIAELDIIHKLIRPCSNFSCFELVSDMGFASLFYFPVRSFGSPFPNSNDLRYIYCLRKLARIALSNTNSDYNKPVALEEP